MNNPLSIAYTSEQIAPCTPGRDRVEFLHPRDHLGLPVHCSQWKRVAVEGAQDAHSSPAKPNRLFEHRIKHRREVAGGGVDDL